MQAGVAQAAGVNAPYAQPPGKQVWGTRLSQCNPPATTEDWCFAFWCLPCAAAVAKADADKSECCYNLMCWQPIGSYAYVRHEYNIMGVCGDDCGYGIFCMPCTTRQIVTEAKIRGFAGGKGGSNSDNWHRTLFDCDCCGFFEALMCPFYMQDDIRGILQPSAQSDHCFNYCCLIPTGMYGQVRHHYGIISDCPVCEDTCVPLFCFPCALNQARNEARWQQQHAIQQMQANQRLNAQVAGAMGQRPVGSGPGGRVDPNQQQQQPKKKMFGIF